MDHFQGMFAAVERERKREITQESRLISANKIYIDVQMMHFKEQYKIMFVSQQAPFSSQTNHLPIRYHTRMNNARNRGNKP